jgi:hypothetical protein
VLARLGWLPTPDGGSSTDNDLQVIVKNAYNVRPGKDYTQLESKLSRVSAKWIQSVSSRAGR